MYKILDTEVRSMPLAVTSSKFIKEWKAAWETKACTNTLLTMIQPFFDHWVRMLTIPGSEKDINYISLCHLIQGKGLNPPEAIEEWLYTVENSTSLQEEFEMLFLVQLSKLTYFPAQASARMMEYVLARDFKQRLSMKIVRNARKPIDIPVKETTFNTLETDEVEIDILLLKHIELTEWQWYLLELIRRGRTSSDIAEITHIPRETFYYEERAIWNRLRQMWSHQEM